MGRQVHQQLASQNIKPLAPSTSVVHTAKELAINPNKSSGFIKAVDTSVTVVVHEIKVKINREAASLKPGD